MVYICDKGKCTQKQKGENPDKNLIKKYILNAFEIS